jgi:hypothetical protein
LVAISNAFPRYGSPDFLYLAGGIVGVVIGILIMIPLIKVGLAERDEKAKARIRNVFLEAGLSEEEAEARTKIAIRLLVEGSKGTSKTWREFGPTKLATVVQTANELRTKK